MGILLLDLKYMYISLLLKMINGFSWPAKIMVSPFYRFPSKFGFLFTINYLALLTEIYLQHKTNVLKKSENPSPFSRKSI